LGWIKSEATTLRSWDTPDSPVISEVTESVGRLGECGLVVRCPLNTRCQRDMRLEGADDMGEFDERSRENLGLEEGETMTAPAVEDSARPTGAYF